MIPHFKTFGAVRTRIVPRYHNSTTSSNSSSSSTDDDHYRKGAAFGSLCYFPVRIVLLFRLCINYHETPSASSVFRSTLSRLAILYGCVMLSGNYIPPEWWVHDAPNWPDQTLRLPRESQWVKQCAAFHFFFRSGSSGMQCIRVQKMPPRPRRNHFRRSKDLELDR